MFNHPNSGNIYFFEGSSLIFLGSVWGMMCWADKYLWERSVWIHGEYYIILFITSAYHVFPGRGALLWPGMAARELTRYPVARLRMINTSWSGGALATPLTMSWRSARTWNLQACGVYFGASPKMMWSRILQTRAATVLVGGCCRRGSRNPPYGGSFVELSAWPSLCEAGELGSCYWMMRRFHGMARCVHLTAALLQAVYRSCLFASVEHIFHWLPLVHFNAWWARARHRIECRWC